MPSWAEHDPAGVYFFEHELGFRRWPLILGTTLATTTKMEKRANLSKIKA
jgi:hypothetical protein